MYSSIYDEQFSVLLLFVGKCRHLPVPQATLLCKYYTKLCDLLADLREMAIAQSSTGVSRRNTKNLPYF